MRKFKVGDRVRMSAEGRDRFQEERCNPYNIEGTIIAFDPEDDDLEWRVEWDNSELNWYASGNIEPARPTHTLTPGQTYTASCGDKWECIAVRGSVAWMVRKYDDGEVSGSAFEYKIDGTPIAFGDHPDYRIVFEPVRETVTFEIDTYHGIVGLEYQTINGTPDWSTAKVTPCA